MLENIIYIPKTLIALFFQTLGIVYIFLSIPFIIVLISYSAVETLIIIVPFWLLSFFCIYIPHKNRKIIKLDNDRLYLTKGNVIYKEYKLSEINRFVLNVLDISIAALKKVELYVEQDGHNIVKLYDDYIITDSQRWLNFSEELTDITNKPLKKEFDY